jgi:tetratricopeptide (TPR) repeat protein
LGLFDFFKSKKTTAYPGDLREALFAAIQASNWPQLADLCEKHHDEIVREFSEWKKTRPPVVRDDVAALKHFVNCMATLAEFFTRVRGEPELLQQLIGPDESNLFTQWPKKLQQAEAWAQELRFEDAITLLRDLLNEVRPLRDVRGDFVELNMSLTMAQLGLSYFQTGRADMAIEPLGQALDYCQRHGDVQGSAGYLNTLFEAHRYLGQPAPAADYAERLADAMAVQGRDTQATWYRKQATIVRAGEPLVRMIAEFNGQYYELDEFAVPKDGYINYVFYRNRLDLRPGLHYVDQAKEFFAQGQLPESLTSLMAASKADPFGPEPWYQMGAVMLYAREYTNAVVSYEKTEELAPGWFDCRRFLWLARQLEQGDVDHDTFLTLQALDGSRQDRTPYDKVALARDALAKTPQVAWLYLGMGVYLASLQQSREAEVAFRRGLDCVDEPDVKSCLLLQLALILESNSPERVSLLEEVRNLNGNLRATTMADLALRAPIQMR